MHSQSGHELEMALATGIAQHLQDKCDACHMDRGFHRAGLYHVVILYGICPQYGGIVTCDELIPGFLHVYKVEILFLPVLTSLIVKGKNLSDDTLPCLHSGSGTMVCRVVFFLRPGCQLLYLGKREQNTVKQSVLLISLLHQLSHTLRLCGSYHIDAGVFDMERYGIVHTYHIQCASAPCRQQLLYQLSVVVAVGGIEHAHNLIHQDCDTARGVVMGIEQSLWSEV